MLAKWRANLFYLFGITKHDEFIGGVFTVTDLSQIVAQGIIHYLRDFQQRVNTLANSVPEEAFWLRPYSYGNSMGNLVSHLTGNIEFYIGTHIAATGYVRDREYEFARNRTESRAGTLSKFDSAVELFCKVVEQQSSEDWGRPYSAKGIEGVNNRYDIILRCTMHIHHHVGQMIYLRKAILQETDA